METLFLDERFLIYDNENHSWVPKESLTFCYHYLDKNSNPLFCSSYRESKENPRLKLEFLQNQGKSSKSSKENKNDESKIFSQMIPLNHLYEIHHYDKESFLTQTIYMENASDEQRKLTPNHIISITLDKEDFENHLFYYYNDGSSVYEEFENCNIFIGCNLAKNNSRNQWEKFKAELYKTFRYSDQGLYDQMQIRFCKLIIKSFKDILRFLVKNHKFKDDTLIYTSFELFSFFKNEGLRLKDFEGFIDISKEITNIVYKCLISEGLLPFYIDLNTMDGGFISWILQSVFKTGVGINEGILPWSPKFHASITILERYYSYTPNNHVNQKYEKDRIFNEKYKYFRIKILDFFPLDDWIIKISEFLYKNFDSFLDEISFHSFSNKYQQEKFDSFLKKDMQSVEIEANRDDLSRPLLGFFHNLPQSNINIWVEYENCKNKKKKEKIKVYQILVNLLNSKNGSILDLKETLPQYLANSFYENYKNELKKKVNILDNFCALLAKTEFSKYSSTNLNCQTIVAEVVLNVYEQMKKYIDILMRRDFADLGDEDIQAHYIKFSSKITNYRFFERYGFIKPGFLNARLDYYGIYVDHFLKRRIEKLIGESENKIGRTKNKKIKTLQKDFEAQLFSLFSPEEILLRKDLDKKVEKSPEIILSGNRKNSRNYLFNRKSSLKEKCDLSVNECLSSLLFNTQNELLENRKEIILYKLKKITQKISIDMFKELNSRKYVIRDLHREFSYYYFNSIRLQNARNERKNFFSYIGFVIIKDPNQMIKEEPENFGKTYDLFANKK